MADKLFQFAESVKSRGDFIEFVELLNRDYRASREDWQNVNLETFLEGLGSFARDMGGYYKNRGETVDIDVVTWRLAAQMLLAATIYGA